MSFQRFVEWPTSCFAMKGGEMGDISPTAEMAALAKLTANWRSVKTLGPPTICLGVWIAPSARSMDSPFLHFNRNVPFETPDPVEHTRDAALQSGRLNQRGWRGPPARKASSGNYPSRFAVADN